MVKTEEKPAFSLFRKYRPLKGPKKNKPSFVENIYLKVS
jgi:hypothetical protein